MLIVIFAIALIWIEWKLFLFGLKATWGILKLLAAVILFPAIVVGFICMGLYLMAIPVLIIVGIFTLIG